MTVRLFDKLSEDFSLLLENSNEYNVVIEVDEGPDKKLFKAHSVILCHRFPYLYNELRNIPCVENNIKVVRINHISSVIFDLLLKYIYGGIVKLDNLQTSVVFDLLYISYGFQLYELVHIIQTFLVNHHAAWLKSNFLNVFHLSYQNTNFETFHQFCNDMLLRHPTIIFDSLEFPNLQENALVYLLKKDDLQLEESKLWDYVIKWGISQNPNFPENLKCWTDENFLTLKTTLHKCLPFIRYFQIPGEDVIEKIQPYQKILDPILWNDIIKYFMAPHKPISSVILPCRVKLTMSLPSPTQEYFPSYILSIEQASEISSWIDKKNAPYDILENPYEFRLLVRGSRDGFLHTTFWDLCDKKKDLVVICKIKDSDEILGGYNPIGWDKNIYGNYASTNNSFIFSLKNPNLQYSICSRVKNTSVAIYNYCNDYGPNFGGGDFKMVTNFQENNCYTFVKTYERPIRHNQGWFSIDEYEVFQIIRKQ